MIRFAVSTINSLLRPRASMTMQIIEGRCPSQIASLSKYYQQEQIKEVVQEQQERAAWANEDPKMKDCYKLFQKFMKSEEEMSEQEFKKQADQLTQKYAQAEKK